MDILLKREWINLLSAIHSLHQDLETLLSTSFTMTKEPSFYSLKNDLVNIHIYPRETIERSITSIQTIHIDEEDLKNKYAVIVSRIAALYGHHTRIYARNTVVARIDKKTSDLFQQENHLQHALPGKYRYGLFSDGELISVAVFSGGRRMNDKPDDYRSFELLRFCNKMGYHVVGGISKLIKKFILDFNPGDLMTYTDLDWNQESSLTTIGFMASPKVALPYFWITATKPFKVIGNSDITMLTQLHGEGYLKQKMGSQKLVLPIL